MTEISIKLHFSPTSSQLRGAGGDVCQPSQCLSDIFLQIVIFSLQLPGNHNTGLSQHHTITPSRPISVIRSGFGNLSEAHWAKLNAKNLLGI